MPASRVVLGVQVCGAYTSLNYVEARAALQTVCTRHKVSEGTVKNHLFHIVSNSKAHDHSISSHEINLLSCGQFSVVFEACH